MTTGWIKLHRSILDKPIWRNSSAEYRAVLIYLLLAANYRPAVWNWNGMQYSCKPGQLVTSYERLARDARVSKDTARRAIAKFRREGFLSFWSSPEGLLITIVNWEKYQTAEYTAPEPPLVPPQQAQYQPPCLPPHPEVPEKPADTAKAEGEREDTATPAATPSAIGTATPTATCIRSIKNPKEEEEDSSSAGSAQSQKKIMEAWNQLPDTVPRITAIRDERAKKLKARLQEYGEAEILRGIENIRKSAFLTGDNASGWIISFDWFLKPGNMTKVLEGNYNGKSRKTGMDRQASHTGADISATSEERMRRLYNL